MGGHSANFDPGQEPPVGSVVAIDWGKYHQEVWVANSANSGNWYTTDIPLRGDAHPQWDDVLRRAAGRTLTLLVAGDADAWKAGYYAGASAVAEAVTRAAEDIRYGHPKDPEL